MSQTGDQELPFRYNARLAGEIESRWQQRWAAEGTFDSPNPAGPLTRGFSQVAGRPKFYVLDMFPYPSGTGLHVGHPLGYIGTDVFARYLRMNGHHVLHTFGYDAFGLPAEQYAIDTGQHPEVTTRVNIGNMRRQLRRLGLGHDSRREISTTDPGYYRWTQWIFLQIFNSWCDERTGRARPIAELAAEFEVGQRGAPDGRPWGELTEVQRREVIDGFRLAYISHEPVNWCPALGTVLASEEVTADGRSDVGNYPVYRRPLRQWKLRITAFADRLIDRPGPGRLARVDQADTAQLDRRERRGADHVHRDRRAGGRRSMSTPPARTRCTAPPTWCWPPSTRSRISSSRPPGRRAPRRPGPIRRAGRTRPPAIRPAAPSPPAAPRRGRRGRRSPPTSRRPGGSATGSAARRLAARAASSPGPRQQPGHRGADPGLPGRPRADGLRDRRHHGRSRS